MGKKHSSRVGLLTKTTPFHTYIYINHRIELKVIEITLSSISVVNVYLCEITLD